jgi:transglutaminase-like putative cysteine protease
MSWRLRIRHRTGFQYEGEVVSSYNEARLTPVSTPDQLTLEADVHVEPAVPCSRYWDYWGTLVHGFDVHVPHTELVVTASSVVETAAGAAGGVGGEAPAIGWDELARPEVRDRFVELLSPTGYVPLEPAVLARPAAKARGARAGRSPAEACEAVGEWVRSHLQYEPGSTTVSSTALDAARHGRGVCQDFAHLTLALLRTLGIPARYVSGYLHPSPEAAVGTTVTGQSHAWVEAWLGDWVALDPTSGTPVAERHVIVGRARDYADVSPLKGIYHGGPATALAVTVELTRLA